LFPVGLVLGVALFTPWGLKEQGVFCLITVLSYTFAVWPNLTPQVARDYVPSYIGLGMSIVLSLISVSGQQIQQERRSQRIAELQRKIQETEVLQEFSRALNFARDRTLLLPPLTQAAQRLCQLQGLILGSFVPERLELELWTQTDPSAHNQRIPLEDNFAREILQVGWPVYVTDLSTPPQPTRLFQVLKDLGYVSLLIMPLRVAHRVTGVLLAGWRALQPQVLHHEEEFLQFLADQTAQTLANIRLYADQERHLNESEALRRVGQSISATLNRQDILRLVTEEASRLLNCEAAMLTLWVTRDEVEIAGVSSVLSRRRESRVPFADSLTGIVVKESRAIRQTEFLGAEVSLHKVREIGDNSYRSFLAVPLWQEGKPMGALVVFTSVVRDFPLDDERILQALADQAVHAITNAQLYAQLQGALQRAQEAYQQKSAFFASVSHELRTPLNIIFGYVDLIREGVIGQADRATLETLDRVRKSVVHLIALINDLLDLARIERAEFHINREPVDTEKLLRETCAQWEKAIFDKGLIFKRVGTPVLPTITADKARLRQILDNLLGNALKFTSSGYIAVGARVPDNVVEIWVEDTGIGIDPADQERIFDEFQQIEQGMTSQDSGVGLGLAVSKKLATLLGGTLKVTSSPGHGSTFTVTLPRKPAPLANASNG
jgi:signal transduction histidine kinase